MKSNVRVATGLLCIFVFGGAVARIAHLRSMHRTSPVSNPICGGELIPCDALAFRNLPPANNYNACWEARQAPRRSPRRFEDLELTMLRKVDEAQCAVLRGLSSTVLRR